MVKIRLSRFGKHKSPFYRIVAIDSRSKRDGEYLELLGTYNPDKKLYTLKNEQIINFLKEGAQPTETVLNILKAHGI
jgi:small subunit ribosomal protein S16